MRISQEHHLVTLINVFKTKPEQQQILFDELSRFAEQVKGEEPGLIGAALHKSIDGLRVVNYAQWRSEEDLRRFAEKYYDRMQAQILLAEGVDPHVYEVAYLGESAGR
jgi:quinol monooxygenase YgiN